MSILILADHDNGQLAAATLNTVTAATQIDDDIHVLVAGDASRAGTVPRQPGPEQLRATALRLPGPCTTGGTPAAFVPGAAGGRE